MNIFVPVSQRIYHILSSNTTTIYNYGQYFKIEEQEIPRKPSDTCFTSIIFSLLLVAIEPSQNILLNIVILMSVYSYGRLMYCELVYGLKLEPDPTEKSS